MSAANQMEMTEVRATKNPTRRAARLPRVLNAVMMNPSEKFGSLEEQMVICARAFRDRGSVFLPLFNCSPPQHSTPMENIGVEIACLEMRRFRWRTLRQLLTLIRRHKIDAVHWNFNDPIRDSYVWWLTVLRPGLKHYYTDHMSRFYPLRGPMRGWKGVCKRLIHRRYSKFVCVSQFVADCLAGEVAPSSLVCVRHFVNPVRFQPDNEARERIRASHAASDRFVVLTVAHLIKAKGVDVLLRALTFLPEDVVLWVVGNGPETDALRRLAEDLGISRRVSFHGLQKHVEPYMQGADCFVCPSLWGEAAGLVNLEAQASGLPLIASDVGGIPEYIADGRTGFLFPAGDVEQLADCIRRLLTDPQLRQRLGRAARNLVEEQFSPTACLDDVLAIYET